MKILEKLQPLGNNAFPYMKPPAKIFVKKVLVEISSKTWHFPQESGRYHWWLYDLCSSESGHLCLLSHTESSAGQGGDYI